MKAAGIKGDIGLVSTFVIVVVSNSEIAVVAFNDATVTTHTRCDGALECAHRERWRERTSGGRDEPHLRDPDRLDMEVRTVCQRYDRDAGGGDNRRRRGRG